LNKALLICQIN